ncbi:hypothetical protein ABZ172_23045 [Streptomyces sp. NPDC006296]|uniref:hypothetical protein n=1 Tax=Streptomyces sp. NPDC006296 TaxID=3156746 RepID=UPI0033AC3E23
MAETLEITTLRPAAGHTVQDFVEANADINAYLRRRPGFLWRRMVETDDGRIIDIVAYDSLLHARAGAAGITGEMADSPVHATIDHDSVDWQITTALQYLR